MVAFSHRETIMKSALARITFAVVVTAFATCSIASPSWSEGADDGVVRVKSAYGFQQTIRKLKLDIREKGIMFFSAINQQKLGKGAKIELRPSTLLTFGNPPLGIQCLTANANAGLDWPVRLLVTQDDTGQVWAAYTDFAWIARRHGITDRNEQFAMASEVIASITSSITIPPKPSN
jgi:uncharacterized protein (DUF302 family)